MNDFAVPTKFLMTIVSFIFAWGLIGQLKPLTMKMALMAIEAHQKDQMSYGKFSRQLWRKSRSR